MLKNNQKGTVFATSLIVAMLLILICVSTYTMVLQDAYMVKRIKFSTQALMLAEAGINDALGLLLEEGFDAKDDAQYFPLTEDLGNDRSYTVTVSDIGGRTMIASTGSAGGVSRVAEAEVKGGGGGVASDYMFLVGNNCSIDTSRDGTSIYGDIHCNGSVGLVTWAPAGVTPAGVITVNATADGSCTGVVSAGGTVTINRGTPPGTITISGNGGVPINGAGQVSLPSFDYNYYKNLADWVPGETPGVDDGDDYYLGDQFWADVILRPQEGVIYVEGYVSIDGDSELHGGIVAREICFPQYPFTKTIHQFPSGKNRDVIIARDGDIQSYGTLRVEEAVLYAQNYIHLYAGSVRGEVIAASHLTATAPSAIIPPLSYEYVPLSPEGLVGGGESEIEIVSWNR